MRTKLEENEEGASPKREDMVCKESLSRIGEHFQLPRQRHCANTLEMVEKNKALLERMRALAGFSVFVEGGGRLVFGGRFWWSLLADIYSTESCKIYFWNLKLETWM